MSETGCFDKFTTTLKRRTANLYPVQNFDGIWREADGVDPHWTLEGDTVRSQRSNRNDGW